MRNVMLCLGFALMLSSCADTAATAATDPADGMQALKAADAALQKAVVDKNLEGIVTFYTEDAVLLPTANPIVVGRPAIREEWQHILSIPNFQNKSSLTQIDVATGKDMAYSTGTYLATMLGEDGKPVTEPGKWLSVWKKQADGSWRIVVDTYNTDIPPPDHK